MQTGVILLGIKQRGSLCNKTMKPIEIAEQYAAHLVAVNIDLMELPVTLKRSEDPGFMALCRGKHVLRHGQ